MPQRPRPGSGRDRVNKRRFGGRTREDRKAQEDEEEKRFMAVCLVVFCIKGN